jgi:hypothetical protein
MGHATELATTIGSVVANPNKAIPEVIIAGLSRKAGLQDRALGGHLYATANQYVKLKLIMDSSRYGPNGPSAIKTYHYEAEMEAPDQAADEIRIMTGGFDAEAAGI